MSKCETLPAASTYEIPLESILFFEELGHGAFGRVLRAQLSILPQRLHGSQLSSSTDVAVKLCRGLMATHNNYE